MVMLRAVNKVYVGTKEVLDFIAQVFVAISDFKLVADDIFVTDNRGAMTWVMTGTQSNTFHAQRTPHCNETVAPLLESPVNDKSSPVAASTMLTPVSSVRNVLLAGGGGGVTPPPSPLPLPPPPPPQPKAMALSATMGRLKILFFILFSFSLGDLFHLA